ncbi:hypothetical protein LOC68_27420 [Blastopirellula sp. JC732]|uniref:Uncharacterized protein n=1 Tax=Blastopirellula sediminis TaxID=2894196 RepID=A0A9X1SJA1_9BACT|nr:hypothetical protein [Blastopirellula sediminis]MCC9604559.1 hypothetical protein [Blastopirellula sediminis]MCC9632142.1 hypothetical protein [Blastopirellula sediminis]
MHDADALQDEAERWKDAALDQRMRSRIRLAMTDLGEAHATKLRVRENCGMNGTKFARAWDRMVAEGEIQKIVNEKQVYYPSYRLAKPVAKKNDASESTPLVGSAVRTMGSANGLAKSIDASAVRTADPTGDALRAEKDRTRGPVDPQPSTDALKNAPTGQPKAALGKCMRLKW